MTEAKALRSKVDGIGLLLSLLQSQDRTDRVTMLQLRQAVTGKNGLEQFSPM